MLEVYLPAKDALDGDFTEERELGSTKTHYRNDLNSQQLMEI